MENQPPPDNQLTLYGQTFESRLLLGTALFSSPDILLASINAAMPALLTVSLRRQNPRDNSGSAFWDLIRSCKRPLLPNTAGCRSAKEAITLAQMSREIFATDWIKLEVIGDDYTLQPDPFQLLEAADRLIKDGFKVLPYCTEDLILCQRLRDIGCQVLMPWGSPIGSGRGLMNPYALTTLRHRLPDIPLIIDAGIGAPSQACRAMELGFDAVLLNTAVANAANPVTMAAGFALAIDAGRQAYLSGLMQERQTAVPSTQPLGQPFWHHSPTHNV